MEQKILNSMMRLASSSLKQTITKSLSEFNYQVPEIKIQASANLENADYLSPSLLQIFNQNKDKKTKLAFGVPDVKDLCKKIISSHNKDDENNAIEQLDMTEQGFLTIKLKDKILEDEVNQMLKNGLNFPLQQKQKILVDFSSPNIAKEMHVGHLRSTIIGESICRIFEFQGHEVLRVNHVGDWGTQFGMLICYMFEKYPNFFTELPNLEDLTQFYKEAKKRFDSDPEFKKKSQLTVVDLQKGDQQCRKAWELMCDLSRQEFQYIYKRLNITLNEYGESYYNDMIPQIVQDLTEAKLLKEDDGALCVFIDKFKKQPPLFIVKKDGGYGYDSTDMAAIKHRLKTLNCQRIVYITDIGQEPHFNYVIAAAEKIGWHKPPQTRCEHMGFGIVLGDDGKRFRTRSSETVKLKDLLDEAKERALAKIKERQTEGTEGEEAKGNTTYLNEQEFEEAAEAMGMAAIKYYDLRQNRVSDYIFSYDKMLDTKGNTAVYLLYSYARLCSILRKSGIDENQLKNLSQTKGFRITHPHERVILSCLVKFVDVLQNVTDDLAINRLTDYIYELACKIAEAYHKYHIVNSEDKESRILLIEATRLVLKKSLYLIGIEPLEKI